MNINQFAEFFGSTYYGSFSHSELKYVFDLFDRNKDSYIDQEDLNSIYKELEWDKIFDLSSLFKKLDSKQNGKLSFQDFKEFMRRADFY
jgi:Ca2+-binding EF-hand superfamily protein